MNRENEPRIGDVQAEREPDWKMVHRERNPHFAELLREGLPSSEDLDMVEMERLVKALTKGK
jgi:hypothetical protein